LARGLAQLPDFEVYITRESISSPTEEEGVTLRPVWCAKLCHSHSRPSWAISLEAVISFSLGKRVS